MATLSAVGEIVRRADPDRFLTSLFAPEAARETLWTLYAFNHELARARETVREPMMALIRLQWWREVIEGAARRHEVAAPVRAALDAGALSAPDLLAMIEGRETDPAEEGDWPGYIEATAGGVAVAAGHALGAEQVGAIRAAGAAYGAAGVLRNRAFRGEAPLPEVLLAGRRWLAAARAARIERPALAAALPAALAARDLRRAIPVATRGIGDKLAVLRAAATCRI